MKTGFLAIVAATFGFAGVAFAEELSEEQLAAINELVNNLRCEVAGDIEIDGDEIELDDVICAGGQFDIKMNMDLHITGARGE